MPRALFLCGFGTLNRLQSRKNSLFYKPLERGDLDDLCMVLMRTSELNAVIAGISLPHLRTDSLQLLREQEAAPLNVTSIAVGNRRKLPSYAAKSLPSFNDVASLLACLELGPVCHRAEPTREIP